MSVSHCDPLHVIALAERPVGVDIERIGSGAGIDAVALHPHERTQLDSLPEPRRSEELLRIWTAKEAALKLTGEGLLRDPSSFAVRHEDEWIVRRGVLDDDAVRIAFAIHDEHVIAVAAQPRDAGEGLVLRLGAG